MVAPAGHDEAKPGATAGLVDTPALEQEHGEHRRAGNHQKLALRMCRMARGVQLPARKTAEDDDGAMPSGQQSRRVQPADARFAPRRR
jgi:hypothetical protein